MMQAGAIVGPIDRSAVAKAMGPGAAGANTVHDLNVPYEGPDEYETPTADLLFPPVSDWGNCVVTCLRVEGCL